MMNKPAVLFLCTGNSARGQMAEAFLRKHGGDRFEAFSAGLAPQGIHPLAVQVMNEIGISLDRHRSKSLGEFLGKLTVRYAIIVCEEAEQQCPRLWPFGTNLLSWPFDDPAAYHGTDEGKLEKFRAVRDQIGTQVQAWLNEIEAAAE